MVGSGDPVDPELLKERCKDADIIVAADGGGLYLYEAGITPDILVGDFDSIPPKVLDYIRTQKNVTLKTFPAEKDFTDMELALDAAVDRGRMRSVSCLPQAQGWIILQAISCSCSVFLRGTSRAGLRMPIT